MPDENDEMMQIHEDSIGELKRIRIVDEISGRSLSIVADYGANINELVLVKDGRKLSVISGYSTAEALLEHSGARSDQLIPFPNRVKGGKYSFDGKEYLLPINPKHGHAIHGLLRDKKFVLKSKRAKEDSAMVNLAYDYRHELEGYPFDFKAELKITLGKNGLVVDVKVKNTGKSEMPFGCGWHPYFKLDEKIDDTSLKLPSSTFLEVDGRMIPTGSRGTLNKFLRQRLIGAQEFDTCFALESKEGKKGKAKTILFSKEKKAKLVLWQETGNGRFNYLQIYIPPSRDSIALEPMSCPADAFNNKEGLVVLKPKQIFKAKYGVKLL
jgi:aldose 1-epimerase